MRWLIHLGYEEIVRVNSDDTTDVSLYVDDADIRFTIGTREVHLRDIKAAWYRKGRHWLCRRARGVDLPLAPSLREHLESKRSMDEFRLSEFVHEQIARRVFTLGNPARGNLNKLSVLQLAREVGLLTPRTVVVERKADIQRLLADEPRVVTKSISDGIYFFDGNATERGYFTYTEAVDEQVAERLPCRIDPSLFQACIDKELDVRVFFLLGAFYAMAILSHRDPQTRIDFRKYNEDEPNRCVPYRLPKDVEQRLADLFARLDLNTGSVDLVVDRQGRHFFLEINPVGQFSSVSKSCNYGLERAIAKVLMEAATNGDHRAFG